MRMKRLSALLAIIAFALPLAATASTLNDIELQVMYMLGQIAALKAERSGSSVACALVASTPSAAVHEPFELIWNSFGAQDPADGGPVNQWARGGISTVILDKPGLYRYDFVFYGMSGGRTTCTATIPIRAAW